MGKNNISNIEGLLCNGCGGCYAVCPSGAIEFSKNEDGCYTAKIIDSYCSSCGKCVEVCSFYDGCENSLNMQRGRIYAMRVKDRELLADSTAGGMAGLIAKRVADAGGMVIGAGFSLETKDCTGEIIGGSIELDKIKGAKYLQSDYSKAFRVAVNTAKENPKAFFTVFGTPCQIYGIRRVTEKLGIDNQFLFIDMFCGGVPYYTLFESYVKKLEKDFGKPLSLVNFSDKTNSIKKKRITLTFGEGVYSKPYPRDAFMCAYNEKVLMNPACSDCSLRMYFSAADIRLGEYRDAKGKFKNDISGISAVLIMSEKGKRLIKGLRNIEVLREYDINECLREQNVTPFGNEDLRKESLEILKNTGSVNKAIRFYRKGMHFKKRLQILYDYIKSFI